MDERLYREAAQAIVDGDRVAVEDVARRGVTAGFASEAMMRHGFAPGYRKVEEQFERGELFLRDLAASAEAMAVAGEITSAARAPGVAAKGRVLVGAVHGDLHDIGKAVVIAHLTAAGYDVTDLGRDVAAPTFVARARELAADVICMSAMPATTLDEQRRVIELIRDEGLPCKTLIGGPLGGERWAAEIGADAYAHDADDAVRKIEALLGR